MSWHPHDGGTSFIIMIITAFFQWHQAKNPVALRYTLGCSCPRLFIRSFNILFWHTNMIIIFLYHMLALQFVENASFRNLHLQLICPTITDDPKARLSAQRCQLYFLLPIAILFLNIMEVVCNLLVLLKYKPATRFLFSYLFCILISVMIPLSKEHSYLRRS